MGPILSRALAALVALGFAAGPVAAQTDDYPRRAITLIVPFAAGGPTDVISRIISDHMSRSLGQSIVMVSFPIEVWKQPRVLDSGAAYINLIKEPVV